jgi:Uma2 family endonuclease
LRETRTSLIYLDDGSTLIVMGLPAEKMPVRATFADYAAVPDHLDATLIGGVLQVMPKHAPPQAQVRLDLCAELYGPFRRGRGGPGHWRTLVGPELHFGPAGEEDIVAPDIAGWRIERLPVLPRIAYFTVAPDWVCEVLSPSTEKLDRIDKMLVYAREGVKHVWLVHPIRQTIEAFALTPEKLWLSIGLHAGNVQVRIPPFDAIELDLGSLWPEIEPGPPSDNELG